MRGIANMLTVASVVLASTAVVVAGPRDDEAAARAEAEAGRRAATTRPATRPTTAPGSRPATTKPATTRPAAETQPAWPHRMLLADGEQVDGELLAVREGRIVFAAEGRLNDPLKVPLGEVDWIGPEDLDAVDLPDESAYDRLEMRDGSRLLGRLVGFDEGTVRFDLQNVGVLAMPMDAARSVVRKGIDVPDNLPITDETVVCANRGDCLVGKITPLPDRGRLLVDSTALKFRVKYEQIDAVFFPEPKADVDANAIPTERPDATTLYIEPGSVLTGRSLRVADGRAELLLDGNQTVRVPVERVRELAFGAAAVGMGRRRILVWGAFSDTDQELTRTIEGLKSVLPNGWEIVRSDDKKFSDTFLDELRRCRALVVPEMERWQSSETREFARNLKAPLEKFTRRGGNVVFCGLNGSHVQILTDLGLPGLQQSNSYSNGQDVPFTKAGRWLGEGVGDTFTATNATMGYRPAKPDTWESYAGGDDHSPCLGLRRHRGWVTVLGQDFYKHNEGTNRMLLNACVRRR